ncbi:3-deoxy-D-manno-octulosonic acid transferase [Rhodobacteraceae bacterium KMM 6894]|nr:3-deoxy-D-manno-octulosonic acid transferase [Rhodobacteraceae bacterium KMM 6894]
MARSLGLAAYLAWARRAASGPEGGFVPSGPRPDGAVIWGHATSQDHARALIQLCERLAVQRAGPRAPNLTLLLTLAPGVPIPAHTRALTLVQDLPGENGTAPEAFMTHWHPDLCLWTGGDLRPALLVQAATQGVPLFLVDADRPLLERVKWRWFPDVPRAVLGRFSRIMTRSEGTAQYLRRQGIRDEVISVTGIFQEGAITLPYNEALREEMATSLRGRPIWLAAMLKPDELEIVLAAHQQASRLAHRLFLIIVPDDLNDTDRFAQALAEGGWRHTIWSHGEMPEEATQVLLADTRGELGLWYRLSPISFMGSSLRPGMGGSDPNEPAAHGSAIIYGPSVGRYLPSYTRYAEAGAARIVRDADTLSSALSRLIAADQAAAMAHAAWDVASVGAEVTDQIMEFVHDTLDTAASA